MLAAELANISSSSSPYVCDNGQAKADVEEAKAKEEVIGVSLTD